MSTPIRASDRDLRALAAIVSKDRPDLPSGEGLPPSLLADLIGQISCDEISLERYDSGRQAYEILQAARTQKAPMYPRTSFGHTAAITGIPGSAAIPTAPATCAA